MTVRAVSSNIKTVRLAKKASRLLITHGVLIVGSIVFIFPLLWLISISLKYPKDMFPPEIQLIPPRIRWENYTNMFKYFKFWTYFSNSIIVTGLNIAGQWLTAPLVAFSFARLKWPGRNIAFYILLGTMMIPADITRIPMFILFSNMGLVDTWIPLTVPAFFGGSAYNIFLIRQFFMTIPNEMEESALVDGAGFFTIYRRIMLPLITPVLTTVTIVVFLWAYNDFMGPLIYLSTTSKYTLSLALRMFQQQSRDSTTQFGFMFASAVLMIMPIIVFFFLGQKKFIEGITLTGLKE